MGPYNSVLATHQLLENADQVYVIDNEALYSISVNLLKENAPTYAFLNYLISQVQMGATFVTNTTALKAMFQRLASQFSALYKRKAFLHWYKGEGMDEMEFQEADKNVVDLITEYQDKQDATVGGDEDEDMDEE